MSNQTRRNAWNVHDMTYCSTPCEWSADGISDKGNMTYKCQNHANKTGHTVVREIGRHIEYHPK